jgi:monofunctional biosynthetic peptidoglycan transglycosylase
MIAGSARLRTRLIVSAALLGVAVLGPLGYAVLSRPRVSRLARERPASTAFIERYQEEQVRAGKAGRVEWRWVPRESISPHLQRAVIVSEDIGFFSHHGFELAEVRQALRDAVRAGSAPRGASTITQQLAKNLWLSPSRNPWRKVKEAILTKQLEAALSKRRILELYLNVAEFAPGVYGAEAGSRHYFGKPAAALDAREAALLAAVLPRPRRWRPGSTSAPYLRQVARIEARMARAGFLWDRIGYQPETPDPVGAAAADSAVAALLSDTLLPPEPEDGAEAGDSTSG